MAAVERNRSAKLYERNRELCEQHYEEVLPQLLEKLNWGTKELILDHGSACGSTTSKYFAPIAEKTDSKIFGLDKSQSMTEYAQEKYSHKRIRYVHGNLGMNVSQVQGLKFDKIFSLYTLHWVDDYKRELKALNNIMVEGGLMYMIIGYWSPIYSLFEQLKKDYLWGPLSKEHLVIPGWLKETEQEVKMAFQNAGFRIIEWTLEEKVHVYKEAKQISEHVLAINSFAESLLPEDYEQLKSFYLQYFTETETRSHKPQDRAAGDPYFFPHTALRVLVQKTH